MKYYYFYDYNNIIIIITSTIIINKSYVFKHSYIQAFFSLILQLNKLYI